MRGATSSTHISTRSTSFQSTLLMRGATRLPGGRQDACFYFNPRSSCEERRLRRPPAAPETSYFNPRSSCEERPERRADHDTDGVDFNPRSSCEERLKPCPFCGHELTISIHAPHARSDWEGAIVMSKWYIFQSTLLMRGATRSRRRYRHCPAFQSTLLMRGATLRIVTRGVCMTFQSTLLMRGATRRICRQPSQHWQNFNPRSSCEERHVYLQCRQRVDNFNPRSSCEERPYSNSDRDMGNCNFNPRSSCEERPDTPQEPPKQVHKISIHAPHARSDGFFISLTPFLHAISIHAPHARSDAIKIQSFISCQFQSTLLMRGATGAL